MSDSKLPLKTDGTIRNYEIQRAVKQKEEKLVRDTIILQKVNKVHREAFREKFPGQIEHCMRLTAERLQALLTKKPDDMTDVKTWTGKPDEILALSHGLYYLSIMNQHYPVEGE
jgi:hypothetical protein